MRRTVPRTGWLSNLLATASTGMVLASLVVAGGSPSAASTLHLPHSIRKSKTDIAPRPDFLATCKPGQLDETLSCFSKIALAYHRALALQGKAFAFNVRSLRQDSPVQQLFVLANIDRVARGLPPFTSLLSDLDEIAQIGVDNNTDPSLGRNSPRLAAGQQVIEWGANWGRSTFNALGAEYLWMYEDGPNGFNLDCNGALMSGCNGHRDNILATYAGARPYCAGGHLSLSMGAAFSVQAGSPEFGEIFVATCSPPTRDIVATWDKVLLNIRRSSKRRPPLLMRSR